MINVTRLFKTIIGSILIIFGGNSLFAQHSTADFISKMAPPKVVKETGVADGNRSFTLKHPYLFIANQWAGLQILDVSDASTPKVVANLRTRGRAHNIAIYNDYLLISDDAVGVNIVDISTINSPKITGSITNEFDTYWVTVKGDNAILSQGKNGFSIWDISNIESPQKLSQVKTVNWNWSATIEGNRLYAADNRGGLLIYDISDLSNPIKKGQFRSKNLVRNVDVEGDYAFLADGPGGMEILNVSNPEVPSMLSKVETGGFVYQVFKAGQFLFLADEKKGLLIVNVSDMNKPFIESDFLAESGAFDVWKENVYVYLCTDKHTMIFRHNNPPVLAEIPAPVTNEQQMLTIQLSGSDPDNDPITYQALNLPEGATFNEDAGYFEWTPTFDQAGSYTDVVFKVIEKTDTKLESQLAMTITVNNINRTPVLAEIEAQQIDENKSLTFVVPEGTDPDKEDLGKLVYIAENIPEGLVFDPLTRSLSWTPTFDQSGVFLIDFLVKDPGEMLDRKTMQITVNHIDRAPVITKVENKVINENENLEFVLEGSDPDKEDVSRIQYKIDNLPEGAVFNEITQTLTWLPTYDQSGTYNDIIAQIISGPKSDSSGFSISVTHVNRPPVLAETAPQAINENITLDFAITGSDPDTEDEGKLTYKAASMPEGAQFNEQTGEFSWLPTFVQSGIYKIMFEVLDPSGLTDNKEATVTVAHINRKPALAVVEAKTIDENSELKIQLSGSDPDAEDEGKLQYLAEGMPEGTVIDASSGLISWLPTYDQSGEYEFDARVYDGNYADTQKVKISVNHVNRPPVLDAVVEKTIDENALLEFSVSGSDPDTEDAGAFVFSFIDLPVGALFNAETKTFSWTPTFEQSGDYNVKYMVKDPAGLFEEKTVQIVVNHVNRVPAIEAVAAQMVDENHPIKIQLIGSDLDTEDAAKLNYTIAPLPDGSVLDAATGLFSWTPTYEQSGEFTVTFTVSDGSLSAETVAAITVNHINRKPVLTIPENQIVNENENLSVAIQVSDPDKEDKENLTLTVENLPDGALFNSTSNTITWTPTFDQAGDFVVDLNLNDNAGLSETGKLNISVENVNRTPQITVPAAEQKNENENIAFTVTVEDPDKEDAGKLTMSASSLPTGAVFNSASGEFTWTPTFAQAGQHKVQFLVTDTEGMKDEKSTSITIVNVNRGPAVEAVSDQNIKENSQWSFTLTGNDPDTEDEGKLVYSANNLPAGCKLNASSGKFEWKPDYDQAGEYPVEVTVKDQAGLTANVSFNIVVENVNRNPEISGPSSKEVTAGEKVTFSVNSSDPDKNDELSFSTSGMPGGANFDGNSGNFDWQTTTGQEGDYSVTIKVKDSNGGEAQLKVEIKVKVKLLKRPEDTTP